MILVITSGSGEMARAAWHQKGTRENCNNIVVINVDITVRQMSFFSTSLDGPLRVTPWASPSVNCCVMRPYDNFGPKSPPIPNARPVPRYDEVMCFHS